MKADVVLGLQWGDEGKGKIVDFLTPDYYMVARFQGGPNAGHSLEFNDKKIVLHTVPSGIFRENTLNLIGNGVVIDPVILMDEIDTIEAMGVDIKSRLLISKRAHLILPTHKTLDAASEASKGKTKIGSTLKGIGPTYMDKTGRNGLRVGDLLSDKFEERYTALKNKHLNILKQFDFDYKIDESEWMQAIERLKTLKLVDSEYEVNNLLGLHRRVLCEGAQGSLLDIDFGTYPYVTSSNTVCAGACTGLGIAPSRIGEVFGIFKAYCTRVGGGAFPTELNDETGEKMRQQGREFGATTGRPRRTGWLDLPALKYSIMVNGVTQLIMMKADVLDDFDKIRVAVAYKIDGKVYETIPYDMNHADIEIIYKDFEGWKTKISDCKSYKRLPQAFKDYVDFIEKETGRSLKVISVGPNRDETIIR
ncbi:MAG: adenylosuccinate synthase [Prevotellaceae bacterium]|jgi:adenylosuccinate synthase|nr:adenylosuccinate synthase [Prevotellaceae bacterium]